MLISDPQQRKTQRENKIRCALQYLNEFIYSDFDTLKSMFGFKNHRVLYSLLNGLDNDGLISKHIVNDGIRNRSLWSITDRGRAVIATGDVSSVNFRPDRLKSNSIHHHLFIQKVYLALKKKGVAVISSNDWLFKEMYPDLPVKPEFVIQTKEGIKIAVIIHTMIHSPLSYKKLLTEYALCTAKKLWFRNLFVSVDDNSALLISAYTNEVTHFAAPVNHEITPQHRTRFRIKSIRALDSFDLDTWN